MDFMFWSTVAQIVIAVFTVVGVLTSLYLSIRAITELKSDRHHRQTPHLAFEPGGHQFLIEFIKAGKRIPGIDPKYVESVFPDLHDDAESVRVKHKQLENNRIEMVSYGRLRNYGLGTALDTKVIWVPNEIWFGSQKFKCDESKLSEPMYSKNLNSMPTDPRNILPNQEAKLHWLPTFIEKDTEKQVSKVTGELQIICTDVFKKLHIKVQNFYLYTKYQGEKPYVHVTFSSSPYH